MKTLKISPEASESSKRVLNVRTVILTTSLTFYVVIRLHRFITKLDPLQSSFFHNIQKKLYSFPIKKKKSENSRHFSKAKMLLALLHQMSMRGLEEIGCSAATC